MIATTDLTKAAALAIGIALVSIICWEMYLRSKAFKPAYDDGPELWSYTRKKVYQPADKAVVFIGSSRIKYDLDIGTWKSITGIDAIQLAIEGNSPVPVLEDLASDKNFKGRLIVDVTEGLFFTNSPKNIDFPKEHIKYYKDQTPTQKAGFPINRFLESKFVLFDRDNYSLNALLKKVKLKKRIGLRPEPNEWPAEFGRITFERQNIMMERFLTDSTLRKAVTDNWLFFDKINDENPAAGKKLDSLLMVVKTSVEKIRDRGGDVLFVRTPCSGFYEVTNERDFPRQKYWDRLLAFTNSPGVHYADYTETDHFICPEWSHLSQPQAIAFTKSFIKILREKNWL